MIISFCSMHTSILLLNFLDPNDELLLHVSIPKTFGDGVCSKRKDVHEIYGPVVCIAPDILSFTGPKA